MKFTPSGTFFVPDRCTLISLRAGGTLRRGFSFIRAFMNSDSAIGTANRVDKVHENKWD